MTFINYIVLSLALGIQSLVAMRNSAVAHPVRLTRGLLLSLLLMLTFVVMLLAGMAVGNLLQLGYPDFDRPIFLGLMVVVIVKLMLSIRRNSQTGYDISAIRSALVAFLVLGINVLLVGMAVGFLAEVKADAWKCAIPLAVVVPLMSFWGVMLGRKQVDIRPKRWQLISLLGLLVVALVGYLA